MHISKCTDTITSNLWNWLWNWIYCPCMQWSTLMCWIHYHAESLGTPSLLQLSNWMVTDHSLLSRVQILCYNTKCQHREDSPAPIAINVCSHLLRIGLCSSHSYVICIALWLSEPVMDPLNDHHSWYIIIVSYWVEFSSSQVKQWITIT